MDASRRHRILILAASLLITACGRAAGPELVASDVEVTRPMPGRSMSAGYMRLDNNGDETIRITGVSSPNYGKVEMHETVVEDDIARMRRLEALTIPPGGSVRLERGGKHLMLMQAGDLDDGITLNLYAGDRLLLTVEAALPAR